jgi:hypothetical protein
MVNPKIIAHEIQEARIRLLAKIWQLPEWIIREEEEKK